MDAYSFVMVVRNSNRAAGLGGVCQGPRGAGGRHGGPRVRTTLDLNGKKKPGQKMHQTESPVTEKEILERRKYVVSYLSVFLMMYYHTAGLYGGYLCATHATWSSVLFTIVSFFVASTGLVVGGHKLWAHRSFKATTPLQIFLMLAHSMAFQFTVHKWVRLHRLHHRYSDTAADPHDASRGLFYSHLGWLMVRRPGGDPALVNMDDIEGNPVLTFQKRHANWLLPTAAFILPTTIPLLWGEDLSISWHLTFFRFIVILQLFCLVNSVSHTWGNRPYDRTLKACQSWLIILLTFGEGHHNFHHAFPFDYRSSEKGWTNIWASFLDVCAKVGLAYDLREVDEESVRWRREMRGDGSH